MASEDGIICDSNPALNNLATVSALSGNAGGGVLVLQKEAGGCAGGSLSPGSSRDSSPLCPPGSNSSYYITPSRTASHGSIKSSQVASQARLARERQERNKAKSLQDRVSKKQEGVADARCVCGGKRGDWREKRLGAGWHDDCEEQEQDQEEAQAPACRGSLCRFCKCAAGLTADCTAVCCCPLFVLHMLVLGCVKVPCVVYRGYLELKSRWRKRRRSPSCDNQDSLRRTPLNLSCTFRVPVPMSPRHAGFAGVSWENYFPEGMESSSVVSSPQNDKIE